MVKRFWGEEKAQKEDFPTRVCPHCGQQADPVEVQKDRITYRCANCKAQNTYIRPPDGYKEAGNRKKLGVITLKESKKKEKGDTMEEPSVALKDTSEKVEKDTLPDPEMEKISTVRSGMSKQRVVSFQYIDRKGKKTFRTIEPYKITKDKTGAIILYGYCLESAGIRAFKLPRIANLTEGEDSFNPRWPLEDLI